MAVFLILDSDSELDQSFDITSEGQEECESSPVVPKVVKVLETKNP